MKRSWQSVDQPDELPTSKRLHCAENNTKCLNPECLEPNCGDLPVEIQGISPALALNTICSGIDYFNKTLVVLFNQPMTLELATQLAAAWTAKWSFLLHHEETAVLVICLLAKIEQFAIVPLDNTDVCRLIDMLVHAREPVHTQPILMYLLKTFVLSTPVASLTSALLTGFTHTVSKHCFSYLRRQQHQHGQAAALTLLEAVVLTCDVQLDDIIEFPGNIPVLLETLPLTVNCAAARILARMTPQDTEIERIVAGLVRFARDNLRTIRPQQLNSIVFAIAKLLRLSACSPKTNERFVVEHCGVELLGEALLLMDSPVAQWNAISALEFLARDLCVRSHLTETQKLACTRYFETCAVDKIPATMGFVFYLFGDNVLIATCLNRLRRRQDLSGARDAITKRLTRLAGNPKNAAQLVRGKFFDLLP